MTPIRFTDTIRSHCKPLACLATDLEPQFIQLPDIRAVLFDIYGTLLISASGDIGASAGDHRLAAIDETATLLKLRLNCSPAAAIAELEAEILASHESAHSQGIENPEVDIVEIWQAVLVRIVDGPACQRDLNSSVSRRFAVEYEVRVNPVWPMPGLEACLAQLAAADLVLGIVSNAQFFTPLLFPAFFDKTIEEFHFVPELSYFSYKYRQAKPGSFLFQLAQGQLQRQGIQPAEVLYVGNDMLNDIGAAASQGFRTALFAGDRRSLRLRRHDQRVLGVTPDVIITELAQLTECLTR